MFLSRTNIGSAARRRGEVDRNPSRELKCAERFKGKMGNTGTPKLLDPFLFTTVMVYNTSEGTSDAEEDEPVARW